MDGILLAIVFNAQKDSFNKHQITTVTLPDKKSKKASAVFICLLLIYWCGINWFDNWYMFYENEGLLDIILAIIVYWY